MQQTMGMEESWRTIARVEQTHLTNPFLVLLRTLSLYFSLYVSSSLSIYLPIYLPFCLYTYVHLPFSFTVSLYPLLSLAPERWSKHLSYFRENSPLRSYIPVGTESLYTEREYHLFNFSALSMWSCFLATKKREKKECETKTNEKTYLLQFFLFHDHRIRTANLS